MAGIIDELGLVELTDEKLPDHPQQCVSAGQVLKAMLLNCLGFVSAPLYLFSEFFESKPTAHLLGSGVEPRHLNDDRLGRVLEQLFELGTTTFFLQAAMQAVERFGIDVSQVHLDSSSFSVAGEYEPDPEEESEETKEESAEPTPIQICRGYSRDHRPDLKQFITHLICSADGGVPLWLKVASGNATDSQEFAGVMSEFAKNWQMDSLFVIDAAFYSEPNLKQVKDLKWLSRVPQTLKAAKDLVQKDTASLTPTDCDLPDYQLWEVEQDYGGIKQRWILVESQNRKADASLWETEMKKVERQLNRELKELKKQVFACKPDACNSLISLQEKLEFHQLTEVRIDPVYGKRGRPAKASPDEAIQGYRVRGELKRRETAASGNPTGQKPLYHCHQSDGIKWLGQPRNSWRSIKGQQKGRARVPIPERPAILHEQRVCEARRSGWRPWPSSWP